MKTSLFVLGTSVFAGAAAALAACASEGDTTVSSPDASSNIVISDAAQGDVDGGDGGDDEGPCVTDCEWFPDTCTDDALCINGPFDSTDPDAGLNPLTQINLITGRSATDVWAAGALGGWPTSTGLRGRDRFLAAARPSTGSGCVIRARLP
ncbi:hypothetical protein AKJ09_00906 [Labilithrix luteola]|uniref:Lipoprotein n=1 Tax=Labilithrix luteola TaxID=1391654 RepID=A0A0K1PL55_9BACT|nr:hypothetical protein [Labilithrix luteola]AKU94242.1 hypothetical protein AKJ09_00906 [Labilithrix luteola]